MTYCFAYCSAPAMKNSISIVGILPLLLNYSLALQIGAFNTGVFGKTKSSKPEVVSIVKQVINIRGAKL